MRTIEYIVFSISSFGFPIRPRLIRCLRAFGKKGSDIVELCEFDSNKFVFMFEIQIKKRGERIIAEIFLENQNEYKKMEKVLRKHHIKGNYLNRTVNSFAFVLKKIDEIDI